MITLTDRAAEHLRKKIADKSAEESSNGTGLRLIVEQGGCAGMQYAMKMDTLAEGDAVFGEDDVPLFVDQQSLAYLNGVEVDYNDGLTDAGFKIRNPNAVRSCGCGTSFEPSAEGVEPAYDPEKMDGSVCGGAGADGQADA